MTEQPDPKPGDRFVRDVAIKAAKDGLLRRSEIGFDHYGTLLQTFNGRDALQDLQDELLDAWMYLTQLRMERDLEQANQAHVQRTVHWPLAVLAEKCWEIAEERGWHERQREFPEIAALLHSEVSEALECWRENWGLRAKSYREDGKPEGIPSELADLIIRLLEFCHGAGIDLDGAVAEKMAYNKTRPHRHGNKRA